MKSRFVLPLVIVAIGIAALLHRYKARHQSTEIDQIQQGLYPLMRYLPPSASFTYKPEGVSTDVYLYGRFILAPRYLSINYKEHFDTVLSVCPYNVADTTVTRIIGNRKLLGQNRDDHYAYFLTCSR
jgi:hypothetical protein